MQSASLFENCDIIATSPSVLVLAAQLVDRYGLQIFDPIIVAATLEAGCDILYSEDMHHGLQVDKLMILNPFV
jgi:predicted nucleic acid-binding protein